MQTIFGPNGQPLPTNPTPPTAPVPQRRRWRRVALWVGALWLLLVFLQVAAIAAYSQVEHGAANVIPQVRNFILQAGRISPAINRENAQAVWREAEQYVLQLSGADWDMPEAKDARRHLIQARYLLESGNLDESRHQSKIAQALAERGWTVLDAKGQEDVARAERAMALANEVVPAILWKRSFPAESAHSYWTAARHASNPQDREKFANWAIEFAGWAVTDYTNWQPMPQGWSPPMPPPGHDGRA